MQQLQLDIWRSWAAGEITDAEAQSASEAAYARRRNRHQTREKGANGFPVTPKVLRCVQRRPRIEARQRIILGGMVPAIVAAGFTVAECAVLAVFAREQKRRGRCDLTVGEIAYLAQCCRTIVQRTLRLAARYALISVDHRRVARNRNLANVVTIVSRAWLAWLRLGPSRPRPWGGGGWPAAKAKQSKGGRAHETERKPLRPNGRTTAKGWPSFRSSRVEPDGDARREGDSGFRE